jgi:hypothetical protein
LHINFAQSLFVQKLYVFHALFIKTKHWPIMLSWFWFWASYICLKDVRYALYIHCTMYIHKRLHFDLIILVFFRLIVTHLKFSNAFS